jgi:hypothetical protein
MLFSPELHGRLAQERIEQRIAAAMLLRRQRQQPTPSIRRQLGHRIMEFGARLAAEPSLESARSR